MTKEKREKRARQGKREYREDRRRREERGENERSEKKTRKQKRKNIKQQGKKIRQEKTFAVRAGEKRGACEERKDTVCRCCSACNGKVGVAYEITTTTKQKRTKIRQDKTFAVLAGEQKKASEDRQ
jgi:hypothetical protein